MIRPDFNGARMDLMQFFDMVLHVDKYLGTVIEQYGTMAYVVLFAIVFCETGLVVLPFLPGPLRSVTVSAL